MTNLTTEILLIWEVWSAEYRPHKDVCILISGTCSSVTFHGQKDLACVVKLRALRWGDDPGLFKWGLKVITENLRRGSHVLLTCGHRERQSLRRPGGYASLALRLRRGSKPRHMGASSSGNGKELASPLEAPEGTQAVVTLMLGPVGLVTYKTIR